MASLAHSSLCTLQRTRLFQIHLGNKDKENPSLSQSQILQGLFWCISHQEGRVVVAIVWERPGPGCGFGRPLPVSWAYSVYCSSCVCFFSLCCATPPPFQALSMGALWWLAGWKALVPLKETGRQARRKPENQSQRFPPGSSFPTPTPVSP